MGLFGKMFEKKECSICGGEIGLLGNRKLADGNLCKNCAKKLSPWFEERRQSTVEDIRRQLDYREMNKEAVRAGGPGISGDKRYRDRQVPRVRRSGQGTVHGCIEAG